MNRPMSSDFLLLAMPAIGVGAVAITGAVVVFDVVRRHPKKIRSGAKAKPSSMVAAGVGGMVVGNEPFDDFRPSATTTGTAGGVDQAMTAVLRSLDPQYTPRAEAAENARKLLDKARGTNVDLRVTVSPTAPAQPQ
jgi:hypothetical protein